ncbi:hypothetical protein EXIGLDRAFT_683706 [Exidia glandulosa HHB12029]|uniref:Rad17-domain-containing protein n=1 Tax=Exidia glandulosa HHB12029 TaxID=1314781 RepID=A0A165CZP5_EXIGL|nr:hypothetical protein EXIGLDRAFT_683706 [Exidia glandulosa HHB12029]
MSQDSSKRKTGATSKSAKPKSTLKLSAAPSQRKVAKPLSSFLTPLPPQLPPTQQPASQLKPKPSVKGKEKEIVPSDTGASLWVDIYEPSTEEELVVHKKKLESIRQWLNEALNGGVLRKYRRILALTGPAGAGKTAAVRVLAREFELEVVEWQNAMEDMSIDGDFDRESLSRKFQNFLMRATSYRPLLASSSSTTTRRLVVLEDLPNILHPVVLQSFHSALLAFIDMPPDDACPLVIIVSDAGVRGEDEDQQSSSNSNSAISIRTVLPSQLLNSAYVTQIALNSVAPTRMRKALQQLLTAAAPQRKGVAAAELLDAVVSASGGDIRSAIMGLQFACVVGTKKGKKGKDILESVTKRENSLALFHLLGKLLYNKRKGDPPGASLSNKDAEREREADKLIPDPPKLPRHLRAEHARPASRVDVNTLYADSPVDGSLLSLYLHQNYTQYCVDVEHCEGVSEWLSIFDSSALPDQQHWTRSSPHQFHLLTLGVLHSLPAPVPRKNQKMFKPEIFEIFRKTREAEHAARDVRAWLGQWGHAETVLELGAVLAAKGDEAPSCHELFSRLRFVDGGGSGRAKALDEEDNGDEDVGDESVSFPGASLGEREKEHGWLESDLIDDI